MFCICTGPYNRQCGLSTCNVASVTEEMNSEFYLPDVAMATILDSAVFSNALSILATLLYMHLSLSIFIKCLIPTMQY